MGERYKFYSGLLQRERIHGARRYRRQREADQFSSCAAGILEPSRCPDGRRRQISLTLDSINPDLKAFYKRGGKLIVVIGTNDTLASPGAQLDYYQSVLKKMGRKKVDAFARLFVLPQSNHGLGGTNYSVDGDGKSIPAAPIPNTFNRLGLLVEWVEKNVAPPMSVTVTGGNRSLPMCSYPAYPKYISGPIDTATSYICAAP